MTDTQQTQWDRNAKRLTAFLEPYAEECERRGQTLKAWWVRHGPINMARARTDWPMCATSRGAAR